ncbi:MAG: DUF6250 domain-containing protein [Brevundimonas sp.]|uniref:DUF6250 domain-containing protein n=1 Tax=Brevundimonas sp. TaxID=1871086 RepID=UPI002732BF5C|nr:DUF6250 domain-containing protein [Brevundimonas sp.]MDP3406257.1 DUF6250 domain-containing protein [Brevundimonas sp.]
MTGGLTRRTSLALGAAGLGLAATGCATARGADTGWAIGPLLHQDDFTDGLSQWSVELERGGTVEARAGQMDIDTLAGASVWFRNELRGPVMIEYDAVAVAEGGPNDQVSDLNAFWMASDPGAAVGTPPRRRSGAFADYDDLLTYYVGQGGNRNTTTRMRRYVGVPSERPILPEHDLSDPSSLLVPNARQRIRLIAAGPQIEYWRDGQRLFAMTDPRPYTRGWFAVRTTLSHLHISRFRVHALRLAGGA